MDYELVKLLRRIRKAVKQGNASLSRDLSHDIDAALDRAAKRAASLEQITAAVQRYGSLELTIDDTAITTPGTGGTWVSSWVFLENER